jgi:endo-1,4-beta-xylanase
VDPDSLRAIAASRGLLYGAAHSPQRLSDTPFSTAFARECGLLVPENHLKWAALRPAADRFDFSGADALLAFADANGMRLRGHTLAWHASLPSWVEATVNAGNAERTLVDHITTVCRRYAGRMHSWDVVNEAVNTGDGRADGLRNSPWLRWLGPGYIPLAFRTAAAADPSALLAYNDYGLDYADGGSDRKRAAVLQLLTSLRRDNVPIHALGIQAHLSGDRTDFDAARLRTFVREAAALGLKVLVTELDVRDDRLPADVAARDQAVADTYRRYLDVVLAEPAVIAVLTWGLSDRYTWLSTDAPRADGLSVRPLPLDRDMARKRAWDALAAALRGAAVR